MSKPPEKCKEQIWATGAFRPTQCSRAAKRDGFCAVHHPEAVAARSAKITAKIDAKQAEWDAKARKERDADEVPALRAALNAAIARADAAEAREFALGVRCWRCRLLLGAARHGKRTNEGRRKRSG